MSKESLYKRLGGYDSISSFVDNLLPRLKSDKQLERFWQNRSDDGIAREKQLLIDYLCSNAGGPLLYTGRDMRLSHKGMKISESDWMIFFGHAGDAMKDMKIPKQEVDDIVSFVSSLKTDIVDR